MPENEIFTIRARICKRCGRIITSKQAIEDGYGHTCLQKVLGTAEINKPMDGQMIFAETTEGGGTHE